MSLSFINNDQYGVRNDIQGLRAIAVLSVIAFHVLLPVQAGFLGVDIFFVISGFIITILLVHESNKHQKIDLGKFAFKRFRRLMPAVAFYVTFVLFVSIFVMAPNSVTYAAKNALRVIFGLSNFFVANVDYFDPVAESNPFLNSWSLSVEQQFYVIAPFAVILLLLTEKSKHYLIWSLFFLAFISSLALALVFSTGVTVRGHWALGSFYSPVVRAWEFIFGMGVAFLSFNLNIKKISKKNINFLSFIAISLMLAVVCLGDPKRIWPNEFTVFIAVATGILLITGLNDHSIVSKWLSCKPLVYLGDRSYSLYLFHWPAVVFAGLIFPRTTQNLCLAAILSIPVALFSYEIVEKKIRRWEFKSRANLSFFIILTISIPGIAALFLSSEKFPDYVARAYIEHDALAVTSGDIGNAEFKIYLERNSHPCSENNYELWARELGNTCRQSSATGPVTIALLGDSHAEHTYPGLHERMSDGVMYFMHNSVPTLSNSNYSGLIRNLSTDENVEVVIILARWANKGVNVEELVALSKLLSDNGKRVVFTDGIPDFPFDAFVCKYKRLFFLPSKCDIERNLHEKINSEIVTKLKLVKLQVPSVKIISTASHLCNDQTCSMVLSNHESETHLVYRDNNHLNLFGSRKHADWLHQQLIFSDPS